MLSSTSFETSSLVQPYKPTAAAVAPNPILIRSRLFINIPYFTFVEVRSSHRVCRLFTAIQVLRTPLPSTSLAKQGIAKLICLGYSTFVLAQMSVVIEFEPFSNATICIKCCITLKTHIAHQL